MKKALLYNFGAALLILVGLVLGILLGENTEANAWIFASAGGMFIYISLVDIVSNPNKLGPITKTCLYNIQIFFQL